MAFDDEANGFAAYADVFPDHTACLVDTYDTLAGTRIAAQTVKKRLAGVRLDSGDLLDLSRKARRILDEEGCNHARIFASSDLNEFVIDRLLQAGAPIDSFGVGTDMVTSRDAPALSVVYKLVAMQDQTGHWSPVIKRSADKATLGCRKQIWRCCNSSSQMLGDTLSLTEEPPAAITVPDAGAIASLLQPYIRAGRLVADMPTVPQIAAIARRQIDSLPSAARKLRGTYDYPLGLTPALRAAQPQ